MQIFSEGNIHKKLEAQQFIFLLNHTIVKQNTWKKSLLP